MADTMGPRFLCKLGCTPMRDLLRGRITGRLDISGRVAMSDLPKPAGDLIRRVVRKTRLWRLEKADVANELIAHFQDGVAAGASVAELIESFGDENVAARLIRRAIKRKRPLAWHVMKWIGRSIAALVVLYVGMGLYFLAGSPSVTTNYVALLNAKVQDVPPEDRAWPLYRQALIALDDLDTSEGAPDIVNARPGDELWPQTVAWLGLHAEDVELARQAAQRPVFGYVLGEERSPENLELWPDVLSPAEPEQNPPLISVLLPYLSSMRHLANVVKADALLAREQVDGDRFVADMTALLSMAEQLHGTGFIVGDLVALGMRGLALDQLDRVLAEQPDLLSDEQLQLLAHRIAGPRVAADLISWRGDRMIFYDVVQRMFTADGDDNGRLTPEGLTFLKYISSSMNAEMPVPDATIYLAGPTSMAISASRKETVAIYDDWMDRAEAMNLVPLFQSDPASLLREAGDWKGSIRNIISYLPIMAMMPATSKAYLASEKYIGQRDALQVAMALELYKRRHGDYPKTLEALTPMLLPEVPLDRVTGEPIRYRLVEGRTLLYSVGVDRDDDGGRVPVRKDRPNNAAAIDPFADKHTDGDWVLFPLPREDDERAK